LLGIEGRRKRSILSGFEGCADIGLLVTNRRENACAEVARWLRDLNPITGDRGLRVELQHTREHLDDRRQFPHFVPTGRALRQMRFEGYPFVVGEGVEKVCADGIMRRVRGLLAGRLGRRHWRFRCVGDTHR
jgi:hypothetical protein